MERMTSAEDTRGISRKFFESKGHQRVDSSSLVPTNDPTLLFTRRRQSVQFKDTFSGSGKRPYTRAATSRKVMRVQWQAQ
ncbi:MAG UNVERIFIED_CONTAM: alanine--tRNA ligase-related protein [Anaerolineae bacterium]|jgi:alanyl-tRNA synthetase